MDQQKEAVGSLIFFTLDEVAAMLKVSKRTVERWIERGDLSARNLNVGGKRGRTLRIRDIDLEAFLERGATSAPREPRLRKSRQFKEPKQHI